MTHSCLRLLLVLSVTGLVTTPGVRKADRHNTDSATNESSRKELGVEEKTK